MFTFLLAASGGRSSLAVSGDRTPRTELYRGSTGAFEPSVDIPIEYGDNNADYADYVCLVTIDKDNVALLGGLANGWELDSFFIFNLINQNYTEMPGKHLKVTFNFRSAHLKF